MVLKYNSFKQILKRKFELSYAFLITGGCYMLERFNFNHMKRVLVVYELK
jgi:hypothetical protein